MAAVVAARDTGFFTGRVADGQRDAKRSGQVEHSRSCNHRPRGREARVNHGRIFHHPTRPHLGELGLSRTLELAAAVLGGGDEPIVRSPRGTRVIPNRQRLAAVAVLGEREIHLSAVQRLDLVDAAAWWLSEPNGGEELAYALLAASCSAEVTTEHVYLALITPSEESDEDGETPSS